MKHLMFAFVFVTFAVAAQANSVYDCTGGNFGPIKVEVLSAKKILINETDSAKVDQDELKDISKNKVSLIGSFPTLGDGLDGFSVEVKVTKYLLKNSKTAYLNTYNRGPGAYYQDSYKCTRRD